MPNLIKKLLNSTRFNVLYTKFLTNPNNINYDKLVIYLNSKKQKGRGKFTIFLSHDKPIYNSSYDQNTYENYLNENIPYDNEYQKQSNKLFSNKIQGILDEKIVTYHSKHIKTEKDNLTLTVGYNSSCSCHYKDPISGQKKCCICGCC